MDVIVSPHFDDAVFSAASVLAERGPAVTVLTVCAGAPAAGVVSQWDRQCGFPTGAAATAGRAREDLEANELAGARTAWMDVTDEPYRAEFPRAEVIAGLIAELGAAGEVWVPAGLGTHPDHVATREAVLAAIPPSSGRVRFYADCPYAFAFGWDTPDAGRDADHRWAAHTGRIAQYLGLAREVRVSLTPRVMELKLAMMSCHQSQVREMVLEFPSMLDADGPMRTEVFWTTARS